MAGTAPKKPFSPAAISEDWQAVAVAFILILLSAAGVLGQNGIRIGF